MGAAKPQNLELAEVKEYFVNRFYYIRVGSMSPERDTFRNNLIIYTPGEVTKAF